MSLSSVTRSLPALAASREAPAAALEKSAPSQADVMSREESRLLARERALRSREDVRDVSVRYEYALGPDGKPYVTAAHVTYREETDREGRKLENPPAGAEETADKTPTKGKESPETARAVAELARIDREVRAHEAAHVAAGGPYVGSASYSYVEGPDGKRYAVAGEVPISAPAGRTPEETIQIMAQVRAAALAPASPSPQDIRVAASASAAEARARTELARADDGGKTNPEDALPVRQSTAEGPERSQKDDNPGGDRTGRAPSPQDWDRLIRAYNPPSRWAGEDVLSPLGEGLFF